MKIVIPKSNKKRDWLIPLSDLNGDMKSNIYVTVNEDHDNFKNIDAMLKASKENMEYLFEIDKFMEDQQEEGEINPLFRYFRERVADGYAWYQVINYDQASDEYLVINCKGICLDDYQHQVFGEVAMVQGDYVHTMIQQRVAMEKIFSKNK